MKSGRGFGGDMRLSTNGTPIIDNHLSESFNDINAAVVYPDGIGENFSLCERCINQLTKSLEIMDFKLLPVSRFVLDFADGFRDQEDPAERPDLFTFPSKVKLSLVSPIDRSDDAISEGLNVRWDIAQRRQIAAMFDIG